VKTVALLLAAVLLPASGCGGRSAVAPDSTQQAIVIPAISGWVHEDVTWGDPPLADAVVEVTGADGSKKTAISNADGFYRIAAGPGSVTVTASKPGYATRTSEFILATDTVLNFSLAAE
jgi:hypothetical protein